VSAIDRMMMTSEPPCGMHDLRRRS